MGLGELRKGTDLIREASSSKKKVRYTTYLSWQDGDSRLVAFLTPADQIPKVKIHQFVKVSDDSERGFHWDSFICRKDPAFARESQNTCDLCDRIGHDPVEKYLAVAVELEPTYSGKRITGAELVTGEYTNKEGDTVEFPKWGLVIQAARNFFSYLATHDDRVGPITDTVFEIVREGNDSQTKYHFLPMTHVQVPDLSEDFQNMIPSVEELVERMGSEEKYEDLAEVEAGSQPAYEDSKGGSNGGSTNDRSAFEQIRNELPNVESYSAN